MRLFLSILVFFCINTALTALDVSVHTCNFQSTKSNYIELNIYVVGNTVSFITEDSVSFKAAVEIEITIKKDTTVVKSEKYLLNTPAVPKPINFFDLKRYALEEGIYDISVVVTDQNLSSNAYDYKKIADIKYEPNQLAQSDIQLIADFKKAEVENAFVKNGYQMENLPFNFYSKHMQKLVFYNEIYNSDKSLKEDYLITYFINQIAPNGNSTTVSIGHKRRKPQPVDVLLLQMDISDLPSGNYELFVEVRDREKLLKSQKKIGFQRSNPYYQKDVEEMGEIDMSTTFVGLLQPDELRYSLKAIAPIINAKDNELLNSVIARKDSIKAQQRLLYNFWLTKNPNNPKEDYDAYMKVAKAIDRFYNSGFGYGFEMDRGFIYLKYGKPNDVLTVEDEPSAPPYEIWVYNTINTTQRQSNVKFLFYNPSLGHNDFRLLHSTAIGEISNVNWEQELYRSAPNDSGGQDNVYKHAKKHFNDM